MPAVNPVVIVYGMYFMRFPALISPKITIIIPASIVAITRPVNVYFSIIPHIITTKAAVGPPICTLLPPNNAIKNPAIMAV